MNALIARSSNAPQRIFPPIGPDLYAMRNKPADLTPDQRAARSILSMATRDFTRMERLLGWKLNASGRLARLLLLHKLGLEAELAGEWQRADHFWSFVREQMEALASKSDLWEAVVEAIANEPGVTVLADPVQLRQRLVNEVFIDTHCAFYNGYLQEVANLTRESRAFTHLTCLKGLLKFTDLSRDDLFTLLVPASERWITLCEKSKQWDQAVRVCTDLLKYLPDAEEYQDRLALLYLARTLERLKNDESPEENLKDAKILQKGIDRLEKTRHDYPCSIAFFEALGLLHHLRAIKLANGKHLSDAILSVQKAITYSPHLKQARETKDKLVQVMEGLQTQMREIQAQLAQHPGARLTKEGIHLVREASRGLEPASAYMRSDEAKRVTEALHVAQRYWMQRVAKAHPSPQEPPVMTGLSTKHHQGGEPFGFWLFSGQDKLIKIQAAIAIILVLLVGGLAIRDFVARSTRDAAYNQIIEAIKNQDYLSVIKGAESYFANTPLSGKDKRDEQVIDICREAFVRWFVELDELDHEAQAHIERYQTLIFKQRGGDRL